MLLVVIVLLLNCVSTEQSELKCDNPKIINASECSGETSWTRCYEENMLTCTDPKTRKPQHYKRIKVNSSSEYLSQVEAKPSKQHIVRIPPAVLRRGRVGRDKIVQVVASLLNSSLFKSSPPRIQGRRAKPDQHVRQGGTVLGGEVLSVTVGNSISNLTQPVRLIFIHNLRGYNGACVYWQEAEVEIGTGHWSTEGCDTSYNETEFTCLCNHLSFFAVLVNPNVIVGERHAANLSYVSYSGSALSVIFSLISLVIYIFLQRRRPEKSVSVHMQLTAALLCLHTTFLLSGLWAWLEDEEAGWGCQLLGFFLHWSLLATFSWMALEGFHLYFLLVRVFNIYVRRYVLKLCLVGWGVPTVIAVACGISGVYGKYTLQLKGATNQTSTDLCWIKNNKQVVVFCMVAYMGLVLLFNANMLGVVVVKLWRMRKNTVRAPWRDDNRWRMDKVQRARLYKDCATVLGLSCVLGLAWGLAYSTYSSSLLELYLFTILNSMQGVFMFLWSLALTCKSKSDEMSSSSMKDTLMQKTTETSFNN